MKTPKGRSGAAARSKRSANSKGSVSVSPVAKKLLDYLPALYRESPDESNRPDRPTYLASFLLGFETLLFREPLEHKHDPRETAPEDDLWSRENAGLEEEIEALPALFDPWLTPDEFLPWLANWAALEFDPDVSLERRRRLLSHIIPLYHIRGTRLYLEKVLALCVDALVSVSDAEVSGFEVGARSAVGASTYIGGGPPHFFTVKLIAPKLKQQEKEVQLNIARNVIELAKPAHTFYELLLVAPQMELGKHSTVGMDTVLGSAPAQA